MEKHEFNLVVEDLANTFGQPRWPITRIAILWQIVHKLDATWFKKTAEKVIASMDFNFDWMKAASAERARLWDLERSKEITTREFQFSDTRLEDIIAGAGAETQAAYKKLVQARKPRDRHEEIEKLQKLNPQKNAVKEEDGK